MPTTPTYVYPTSAELMKIDPILMETKIADDPLIGPNGIFPVKYTDADKLIFEQRDSYNGKMQFRGLNGEPPRVKRLGVNRYEVQPGYYGEFKEVDEAEMTRRAAPGTWFAPIDIEEPVLECHEELMERQTNLMKWICAQLLTTGTYVVLDKDGAIGATDSYNLQVFAAPISWATSGTAIPLANLRQIPVLGRGQSSNFGSKADAWMTQVTFNNMVANTNTSDLRGERLDAGRTVESLSDVNLVLTRNNLPNIRIYEDGYIDEKTGVFHTFVPDNVVVYIGKRNNNQSLGQFRMTRNVNAPTGMGVYDKIVREGFGEDEAPPARIGVHRGFNGGPIIYYPRSIFVMQV